MTIFTAVMRISARERFGAEGYAVPGRIGAVEGVVHELCHWVTLGRALPRKDTATLAETVIARDLHGATDAEANANEVATIGAELVVMRSLRIGWRAWHTARLLAYALRGLRGDYQDRYDAYRTRMLRSAIAPRARRVADAVLRHVREAQDGCRATQYPARATVNLPARVARRSVAAGPVVDAIAERHAGRKE